MLKIAFVVSGLGTGGKERQLLELIKFLQQQNHRCYVFVLNQKSGFHEKIMDVCEEIIEVPRKNKKSLGPILFLKKNFKKRNIDIIHTYDTLSSFFSYLPSRILHIKWIEGSIRDSGVEKGLMLKIKKLFLYLADGVISNSKAGLDYYRAKGMVVYNAIDKTRFFTNTANAIVIVKVASFSDYKDHDTFFKAAFELAKSDSRLTFKLIGSGKHLEKYKSWVNNSAYTDKFEFMGVRSDVEKLLSECSIGVLCSTKTYSEGVSNSVLEYMAAGLYPIASDIGGSKEIIAHGVNGLLYETGNHHSLKGAISRCIQERKNWDSVKFHANSTLDQKFSFSINNQTVLNFYYQLLN